jgi:large subunit ribosomal protein L22
MTVTDQATARLTDEPISTKVAVEIADHLRGRSTDDAKTILEDVLNKDQAIPFKKFQHGAGHRKGNIGAGKYPEKASKSFLTLIKSAEHNARDIGLAPDLKITELKANKGTTQQSYGRQRGRNNKTTHVDITVTEQEV